MVLHCCSQQCSSKHSMCQYSPIATEAVAEPANSRVVLALSVRVHTFGECTQIYVRQEACRFLYRVKDSLNLINELNFSHAELLILVSNKQNKNVSNIISMQQLDSRPTTASLGSRRATSKLLFMLFVSKFPMTFTLFFFKQSSRKL